MDLNLGHTQDIIEECREYGLLRNQTAYVLATAYWETGRTMKPVKEAYWLSEAWRKNNLRYYPWYGRGFVQLTWEANYIRAGQELGLDLTTNPNDVMEPETSAKILVKGMAEGWFTTKRLDQYITLQRSDFVGARRIVNGTDKAQAIAEIARDYDAALKAEGYGEEEIPIANEKRDGTPPKDSKAQSTTLQATVAAGASGAAAVGTAVSKLDGTAQLVLIGAGVVMALALVWIARERIKRWAEGDR